MEADWEVEVGGGAPVIEALWAGYVDLRQSPERVEEIAEATAFPALGRLLLALNGADSPVWTAKCDVWEPEEAELGAVELESRERVAQVVALPRCALACYVDLLPREGNVFAQWKQAEDFCREWVARLAAFTLPGCSANLIVRQAIAGEAEGFGITAYLSAESGDHTASAEALAATFSAFTNAIPPAAAPEKRTAKLQ